MDFQTFLIAQCVHCIDKFGVLYVELIDFDKHDHDEKIAHDLLGNIADVGIHILAQLADLGDNADRVLTYDGDYSFHIDLRLSMDSWITVVYGKQELLSSTVR